MLSQSGIRKQLRKRRKDLNESRQLNAGFKLAKQISQQNFFIQAKSIALYLPNDGEVSTLPLLRLALAQNKNCYLPCVDQITKPLHFRLYRPFTQMQPNLFNIAEPNRSARTITPRQLDLVFVPLVAFDRGGSRIGMGGGFYDKTFAFKQQKTRTTTPPHLVGLAHSFQQVQRIKKNKWDIPLAAVVTEKSVIKVI